MQDSAVIISKIVFQKISSFLKPNSECKFKQKQQRFDLQDYEI